jgi:hypothetical protein
LEHYDHSLISAWGEKRYSQRSSPLKEEVLVKRLVLSLLTTLLLGGCMVVPGHLYPVAGPLSTQTPPPIFDITLNSVQSQKAVTATIQNGEVCQGTRIQILQNDPSANRMSVQWDLVYGQGFFVANVLGSNSLYRADLTGTSGTTVTVEFYLHNLDMSTAKGIAQDSRGNVYKLTASAPTLPAAAAAPAK